MKRHLRQFQYQMGNKNGKKIQLEMTLCKICKQKLQDPINLLKCRHTTCRYEINLNSISECLKNYFIQNNEKKKIKCPSKKCKLYFSQEYIDVFMNYKSPQIKPISQQPSIENFISLKQIQDVQSNPQIQENQERRETKESPLIQNPSYQQIIIDEKDYIKCINKSCGAQIEKIIIGKDKLKCSSCEQLICALCEQRYHARLSCTESKLLYLQYLRNKKKQKKCPFCNSLIIKSQQCNVIQCNKCENIVCFLCLKNIKSQQEGHYLVGKCKGKLDYEEMYFTDFFKDRDDQFTILSFFFMLATMIVLFRLVLFILFEFPVLPFKLIIQIILRIILLPIEIIHEPLQIKLYKLMMTFIGDLFDLLYLLSIGFIVIWKRQLLKSILFK